MFLLRKNIAGWANAFLSAASYSLRWMYCYPILKSFKLFSSTYFFISSYCEAPCCNTKPSRLSDTLFLRTQADQCLLFFASPHRQFCNIAPDTCRFLSNRSVCIPHHHTFHCCFGKGSCTCYEVSFILLECKEQMGHAPEYSLVNYPNLVCAWIYSTCDEYT